MPDHDERDRGAVGTAKSIEKCCWNTSSAHCAADITIEDADMVAIGYKGYCSVRANTCVQSGDWYFELEILEPSKNNSNAFSR